MRSSNGESRHDALIAGAAASGLVIFPVLGVLTYAGLFYLIKDKIHLRMNS
jgi:hypothetical protein